MVQYQDVVFKGKELTLVNIADIHFGNNNCDVDMVNNVIRYIKDHDCVWIGGSFLRGYQLNQTSYVEEKTYVPTTLGSPILHITPQSGKHGVNFKIVYEEIR
jgi:predicted MPP superfamily phosphohydrolase